MERKGLFLIFWSTILFLTTLSGQEFVSGYYIAKDGQTVQGQIQDNGFIKNSAICIFRKEKGAPVEELDARDIARYFIGEQEYIARSLEIQSTGDQTIQDVFIRYHVQGSVRMFSFYDAGGKQRYYLEKKGIEPRELYVTTREVDGKRFRDKRYIGVFKYFFTDCAGDLGLDDLQYGEAPFIDVLQRYHQCTGQPAEVASRSNNGFKLEVVPQVGMNYFSAPEFSAVSNVPVLFEEQPDLSALFNRSMQASFGPAFGVNLMLSGKRQPNFFFQTGVHFFQINWESDDAVEQFKYDILEIPFLLQYRFQSNKRYAKVTPFLQFGFIAPVMLNHSNTNNGVFNLIELVPLDPADPDNTEFERNKIGEDQLVYDDATFTNLLKVGGGLHFQLGKQQLLLQLNYGYQSETELSPHLLAKSRTRFDFGLSFIPAF